MCTSNVGCILLEVKNLFLDYYTNSPNCIRRANSGFKNILIVMILKIGDFC